MASARSRSLSRAVSHHQFYRPLLLKEMPISSTLSEDLIANAVLAAGMIVVMCARDLCKRVVNSDCRYEDGGLKFKLPTLHSSFKKRAENNIDILDERAA